MSKKRNPHGHRQPWKKFIGLLPGGVRAVGTVTAVNTASGTGVAVGSKSFVVDGQITGPAPELPQYDIEV